MKAIRVHQFGGPEVLRFENVSEPKPRLAQILIRTGAVGVNPVETYLRSGANPKRQTTKNNYHSKFIISLTGARSVGRRAERPGRPRSPDRANPRKN